MDRRVTKIKQFMSMDNLVPRPKGWTKEKSQENVRRRIRTITSLTKLKGFRDTTTKRRRRGYLTQEMFDFHMKYIDIRERELRADSL